MANKTTSATERRILSVNEAFQLLMTDRTTAKRISRKYSFSYMLTWYGVSTSDYMGRARARLMPVNLAVGSAVNPSLDPANVGTLVTFTDGSCLVLYQTRTTRPNAYGFMGPTVNAVWDAHPAALRRLKAIALNVTIRSSERLVLTAKIPQGLDPSGYPTRIVTRLFFPIFLTNFEEYTVAETLSSLDVDATTAFRHSYEEQVDMSRKI